MMIIDHIATGILFPQTIKRFQNCTAMGITIIASILPDLPVVISGWQGSIKYLSHRSATHSFILAPLFCFIPVLLISFLFKKHLKNTFTEMYLLSFISYCIHILFDLVTPFGTQIFFPLSKKQYSFDLLHSFDPIFMVISICIIVVSILNWMNIKFFNTCFIVLFLSIYLVYCGVNYFRKQSNSKAFTSYITTLYKDSNYLLTVPKTFWRWKGIAQTKDAYIVAGWTDGTLELKEFPRNNNAPEIVWQDDYYIEFLKYARYPVIETSDKTIEVHNLIYAADSYRLILTLDKTGNFISRKELTGFNIEDKNF